MIDKATLRRSLLTARQDMAYDEWREKSDRLCLCLQQSALFQQATTILAYFSIRNEPDLSPLFQLEGHQWGFPRCVGQQMEWHRWSPSDNIPLQKGAFGILEPPADAPRLEADDVDLLLVPSVACDRQGYRLGYGGGFYDRLFSDMAWKHKPTIGIVFSHLIVADLPTDPWDYPLRAVCTDMQLMMINS